jgi:hypothetical protein
MTPTAPISALAAALGLCWVGPAGAQGLLDRLFGGLQPQPSYETPPPLPPPSGAAPPPVTARPSGPSRTTVYCVRLCDGRFFPIQPTSGATPAQLCAAFCPLSPTKIFSGNDIKTAVAADGSRYTNLAHAYLHRERFVANCSCDGKDSVGLAPIDLNADTALRAGDLVATPDGLAVFKGWTQRQGERQSPTFTPLPRSPPPAAPDNTADSARR